MEQEQLDAVWQEILGDMKSSLARAAFMWLSAIHPLSLNDSRLVLGAPSETHRDWILGHYLSIMEDAVVQILKSPRKIEIRTVRVKETQKKEESADTVKAKKTTASKTAKDSVPHTASHPKQSKKTSKAAAKKRKDEPKQGNLFEPTPDTDASSMHIIAPGDNVSLNPKYTFETFVTGSSNRFAHAAAMAVADNPGKVYNPFFIYGGVGLGKTHLMHAIGNRALQNHPDCRVLYVSSEQFTNELIHAIQEGRPDAFRQRYRTIDILMIDDIQFISGKVSTQEEFFNTFNALHVADKAIIISSDRPPREVQKLEDRLRSRFEGGLTTDIQAPDLETRIAILKNKAILDQVDIPNDVMIYIATCIDSNIRELEGALTRIVAYASLYHKPITKKLAAEALQNVLADDEKHEITLELVQEIVASHFNITIANLQSKKKARKIAHPRQIAMYLCRQMVDESYPTIGKFFGGRDHTTVLHAYDKISKERENDPKLAKTIAELEETINRVH